MEAISKPSLPGRHRSVVVLMGGWSWEREVSLASGNHVVKALQELGHTVFSIDPDRDLELFSRQIKTACHGSPPDVIFNILHGRWGEDGVIQGALDLLGIPYTFSGVLSSCLSMNKAFARQVALSNGLRCPEGRLISLKDYREKEAPFFPHVVKPLGGGSTIGVHLVKTPDAQVDALKDSIYGDPGKKAPAGEGIWGGPGSAPSSGGIYGDPILLERYIPGREVQVCVFGARAMGAVEIRFEGELFSYEAKYTPGKAAHLVPAPIHPHAYRELLEMAEKIHKALNCKGVTRSDFRYDDTKGEPGVLYYLETNTQPGLTPLSLVPDIAAHYGWSYREVVQWILEDALG